MKPINAVGAVVYRVRQKQKIDILLIKKQHASWSLPKGKLKAREESDEALLRELYEETGVEGVIEDLIAEASYQIEKPAGPRQKVVTYYLVRATGGKLRPGTGEKIVHVRWTPLARALTRLRRPRLRMILRAAQTLLGPVEQQELAGGDYSYM